MLPLQPLIIFQFSDIQGLELCSFPSLASFQLPSSQHSFRLQLKCQLLRRSLTNHSKIFHTLMSDGAELCSSPNLSLLFFNTLLLVLGTVPGNNNYHFFIKWRNWGTYAVVSNCVLFIKDNKHWRHESLAGQNIYDGSRVLVSLLVYKSVHFVLQKQNV